MRRRDITPPNFFIIGAPKCGTTALSTYLRTHPDVYFSTPKEPGYFASDLISRKRHHDRSLDEYLTRCFSGSAGRTAVGEGTVRYLYSRVAVPRILEVFPEARFIVMLRHPVDLGHSLFHQHRRNNNEDAASFEEAWALQAERARGERLPPDCAHPLLLAYEERCRLGDQVERLLSVVPDPRRILFLSFKDFTADTRRVYETVLGFLGLPLDGRSRFPVVNDYSVERSPLVSRVLELNNLPLLSAASRRLKRTFGVSEWAPLVRLSRANRRALTKVPISPAFRAHLTEHFRSDVEKLRRLTGIDVYS